MINNLIKNQNLKENIFINFVFTNTYNINLFRKVCFFTVSKAHTDYVIVYRQRVL